MTRSDNANIAEVLWQQASSIPDLIAVHDLDSGLHRTYAELADRVAHIGGGLSDLGLRPGDRVALLMNNSCAYVEAFYGVVAAGLVVVPFNTRLTTTDFVHMLTDAQCSAIVTEAPFIEALQSEPSFEIPLVIDAAPVPAGAGCPLDGLSTGPRVLLRSVDRSESDLCSLMYTSGTTGSPKAVMLTHRSWNSVAETSMGILDFDDRIQVMHPAPLTHGAGFTMLPTLLSGGTNVTTRGFDPLRTSELIAAGAVDAMFLVPSMIRMLLDVLPSDWTVPPTFRWIYYAGSPVTPATLLEATRAFEGKLVQSFAQMESPMFITTLSSLDHLAALTDSGVDMARSAGTVIPGRRVRIVVDGEPADKPYAIGEIEANAPQTMAGYWKRADASTAVLDDDGWLRTGDLGYFDDNGYLYVVDRLKDMIVTGGSNVYASEVEHVLDALDGVSKSAVVGLPHRVWGEEVTAVVVADDGVDLDAETLRAECRSRLAGYKVPKRVVFVDALPTNAYGKILKKALRHSIEPTTVPPIQGGLQGTRPSELSS